MELSKERTTQLLILDLLIRLSLVFFFFFFFFFSMKVYAKEQGIQDSIANGQYPNYKDTNRQNEKEANNKVKLMKVWI